MPTLPDGTVKAENLWKRYRADTTPLLLHDQLKKVGRRLRGERRRWRWVLRDINLEVEPGGTLALVGLNGSGKTTLLKVLSNVTFATAGQAVAQGRIGALLEVRTGIHPDLTARENVYFYGTILGMSRKQISERFDTIVQWSELSDSIDRQVKFCSAGMQVRLGFSIAAFLEPDVLVVDEVLAVGDASFQQKCLERMGQVVANGTTLLFVSHDLAAVEAMCDRALWLDDGIIRAAGPVTEVLELYRGSVEETASSSSSDGPVQVLKVDISGPGESMITSGEEMHARFVMNAQEKGNSYFFIGISEGTAMPAFIVQKRLEFPEGDFELKCVLEQLPLPKGHYTLWMAVVKNWNITSDAFMQWQPVASFDVFGPNPTRPPKGIMLSAPIHVSSRWETS